MTSTGVATLGRAAPDAILAGAVALATAIVVIGLSVALFLNPCWVTFAQDRAGAPAITGYTPRQVQVVTGAMLAVAVTSNRRSAWLWRAIGRGATMLVALGLALGVASLLFFDAAFRLFHLVVFPQGNFSFDPRTQRLTQLFPEQLWTETALAIAVAGLTIAAGVSLIARRRAARLAARGRPGSPSGWPWATRVAPDHPRGDAPCTPQGPRDPGATGQRRVASSGWPAR